jgi:hypothetical protein
MALFAAKFVGKRVLKKAKKGVAKAQENFKKDGPGSRHDSGHGHQDSGPSGAEQSQGQGQPEARVQDPSNPIRLMQKAVQGAAHATTSGIAGVPHLKEFGVAIVVILVIIAVALLAILLLFHARPVLPVIWHSMDFDKVMQQEYSPSFVQELRVFAQDAGRYARPALRGVTQGPSTSKFSDAYAKERRRGRPDVAADAYDAAMALVRFSDDDLVKNIRWYFEHFRCYAHGETFPYSTLCRSSLKANDFWVNKADNTLNERETLAFAKNIVTPMEILRNATKAISTSLDGTADYTNEAWYRADPRRAFRWVMSAHKLRMYLNEYHRGINLSAMSRIKDTFAWNIWIIYYVPYVADIFKHRIPAAFKTLPQRFTFFFNLWMRWWAKLGNIIVNIPCYIVFTGEQRKKYCSKVLYKPSEIKPK